MKKSDLFLCLLPLAALSSFFLWQPSGTAQNQIAMGPTTSTSASSPAAFKNPATLLFATYCVSCHSGAAPEGDLDLAFTSQKQLDDLLEMNHKVFELMIARVTAGEMPPKGKPKPTEAERDTLVGWIKDDLLAKYGVTHHSGQVARVRRLSRVEYMNTVRDLFYFKEFKADDLPPDDLGYGFDNIADLLTISANQMELYLKTAEQALVQLDSTAKVSPNWAEKDGTYSEPDDGVFLPIKNVKLGFNNNQTRVRMVLEKFLPRAYRRPVKTEEIDRLMAFAQLSLAQEGESFIKPKSTYLPLRAALCSPYFLYRIEEDPAVGTAAINEYELASRLSYFLWSSMPDDELFALAEKGELRAHQQEQVMRMLKDPKARALTDNFARQWLHMNALTKASPDPKVFPEFDDSLRSAMRQETELFVSHIIQEDASIMDFLDADYSFLNERLAKHYGIDGISGDEFRMVKFDSSQHRGGLLTQGSILTLTSPPNRTSPVKRGVWVIETLFNNPPSPPPADVPPLEATTAVVSGTMRKVLEAHRENPTCAGCHSNIDPFGLALENFNAIGVWRSKEGDADIDASGVFPDGRKYRDLTEFRQRLNDKKDDFRKALVQQLFIYALGRGLEHADTKQVDEICTSAASQQDRFSTIIMGIVNSDLFQKRSAKGN